MARRGWWMRSRLACENVPVTFDESSVSMHAARRGIRLVASAEAEADRLFFGDGGSAVMVASPS